MNEKLENIARAIQEAEKNRVEAAQAVRASPNAILEDAFEKGVFLKAEKTSFSGSAAAVDGGLLAQEFHGFDLVLSRAVGVRFDYENGKLTGHAYHPSPTPPTELDALSSLDLHDFNLHKSLFRLKKELSCALECVKIWKPSVLFMDGSLVPQSQDKPPAESGLLALYEEVLKQYAELFKATGEGNTLLLGVIKDSRGKRFCELLRKAYPGNGTAFAQANDSNFLHHLLQKGERTVAFRYTQNAQEHQVVKDLKEWGNRLGVFYLKPSEDDRPLRVEFINVPGALEKAVNAASALSSINKRYAYPAVLIEADMRAAMNPIELERAFKSLQTRAGKTPSLLSLRRDERPFR